MHSRRTPSSLPALTLGLAALLVTSVAGADTLRVATWNVNLDTTSYAGSDNHATQTLNIVTAIEGMGQAKLNDNGSSNIQNVDVLAFQELSSITNLQTITTDLNAFYGAGTYAYANFNDPTTGGTGGGPSGLIYNTKTVNFISASTLSSASGGGAARAPVQFTLAPVGYTSAANFFVDVSHMKSGTDSSSASRRNIEAQAITNNTASLGSSAHVIALGDFNITSGSNEPTYQTLISKFHDVALPSNVWNDATTAQARTIPALLTESTKSVRFRDDIQFVSPAADSGSLSPGLQYDAGSYLVFGNGGSSSIVSQSILSSGNAAALSGFSSADRSTILNALFGSSDHLPVLADYDIVGLSPAAAPEPASALLILTGLTAALAKRRRS